jgi:hypothetical protein
MGNVDDLLKKLSPSSIAANVEEKYYSFLLNYRVKHNTVTSPFEHDHQLGKFYKRIMSACVSIGGDMDPAIACERAKSIINRSYSDKFGGNYSSAYKDAKTGMNGGLHGQFQMIMNHLIDEERRNYITKSFVQEVDQHDFEAKCSFIRAFLEKYGQHLGDDIEIGRPEKYAHMYQDIIVSYSRAISNSASLFNSF